MVTDQQWTVAFGRRFRILLLPVRRWLLARCRWNPTKPRALLRTDLLGQHPCCFAVEAITNLARGVCEDGDSCERVFSEATACAYGKPPVSASQKFVQGANGIAFGLQLNSYFTGPSSPRCLSNGREDVLVHKAVVTVGAARFLRQAGYALRTRGSFNQSPRGVKIQPRI